MLFLDFVFDDDRDVLWLGPIERPLQKVGKLDMLSVVVALVSLALAAQLLADSPGTVLLSGVLGVITYAVVNGLSELLEVEGEQAEAGEIDPITRGVGDDDTPNSVAAGAGVAATRIVGERRQSPVGVGGKAAFLLFLYLEVIDASFSFDGVIGAFAITQNIFIIAAGLGVGAMYIRSMTVYLVRQGTLEEYVFLEHGAFWAIGALAGILLFSISFEVPEVITGLVGVGFIAAAFASSLVLKRKEKGDVGEPVG